MDFFPKLKGLNIKNNLKSGERVSLSRIILETTLDKLK